MRHSRLFCTRWNGVDKANGVMDALDDEEYSGSLVTKEGMDPAFSTPWESFVLTLPKFNVDGIEGVYVGNVDGEENNNEQGGHLTSSLFCNIHCWLFRL